MNLSEQRDVIPEGEKELVWCELRNHFIVPTKLEALVKHWALSNMAK